MRNHWKYDRTGDTVLRFADRVVAVGAMKLWLGLDPDTEIDEDNALYAFERVDDCCRAVIVEAYVEDRGLEDDFNEWFQFCFGDGCDEDDLEGYRIDEAYARALDREWMERYA